MSIAEQTLTLVEFLKMPETEPAGEYIDGKVVQKVSPKFRHSRLQGRIAELINEFTGPQRLGEAVPELRCTFAGRSYVFDISYFRADRIAYGPDGELVDDVFLAPDLAIEIRSPEQSARSLESKLRFCVQHGVRLAWLIDPERRRVTVFRPGARPVRLGPEDVVDGGDVLPRFRLPVRTIFGWLRRSES
jgi:Uma2 family endonuclease